MAATVANLTLVALKLGMMGKGNRTAASLFTTPYSGFFAAIIALLASPGLIIVAGTSITKPTSSNRGFRPDF